MTRHPRCAPPLPVLISGYYQDEGEINMKRILIVALMLSLLIAVIPMAGCASTTKIGDITANPMQFQGKEVSVKGTVGDTLWLAILTKGAYQVGDGSGTIWVVTVQPPPQKGLVVSAKGTVSTAFKLGDQTLGTIITETQRN